MIVLVFGTFDPLHEGHEFFLQEAKKLGDKVHVVIARDSFIKQVKKHEPYQLEQERLQAVQALPYIDEALLGEEDPSSYTLLQERDFDVLALGYDQMPDAEVEKLLQRINKSHVVVKRIPAFKPDQFKSSYFR